MKARGSLVLLALSTLGLAAGLALRPDLSGHGLQARYSTNLARVERIAWFTSNDAGSNHPPAVEWSGYLVVAHDGDVTFRAPRGGVTRLAIDGLAIFGSTPGGNPAPVMLRRGAHEVHLSFTPDPVSGQYFEGGLEWRTPLGWRLVPPVFIYPTRPDLPSALVAIRRSEWSSALFWLSALITTAWGLQVVRRYSRLPGGRIALGLSLMVMAALLLRMLFLRDLASRPNADLLPMGSDQRGYQHDALEWLRGAWPPPVPFYMQPGMTYVLGSIYSMLGPRIRLFQAAQMAAGALATLLVFDLGRRMFGPKTGWLAGMLWAAFPLAIFYDAQLLTHALEAQLSTVILWLWFRALNDARWGWPAALGLVTGAASVLRPTYLALAPLMAASLAWRWRPAGWGGAARAGALVAALLLPIAPITAHNYSTGHQFQPVSGNGPVNLYIGNNRDASGEFEYSLAFLATHELAGAGQTTFLRQALADIRNDPVRWLRLLGRKAALTLGDRELPNNVDFYSDGVALSRVLGILPIRFGLLAALGLTGVVLALCHSVRGGSGVAILLGFLAVQLGAMMAFLASSRFRTPAYPALILFAAWALADTWERIARRFWASAGRRLATFTLNGALIAAAPFFADRILPRPVVASLPPTARTANVPMGESLALVGYEPLHAVKAGRPILLTLYWQSRGALPDDVQAGARLIMADESSEAIAKADQAIGTGSYPDYPTSRWVPGQIVRDQFLLLIPPQAAGGTAPPTIRITAYTRENPQLGQIILGPMPSLRRDDEKLPDGAIPVNAEVDGATLLAFRSSLDRSTLALTLYWKSNGPMPQDGMVFVHFLDSAGRWVAGHDGRPVSGLYWTQTWQAGEVIADTHRLQLPPDLPPGEYTLLAGMYDSQTQERFAAVDGDGNPTANNELLLQRFSVGGSLALANGCAFTPARRS